MDRLSPSPPPGEQELIPIAEAARWLGLSRNAVQRRIEWGLLTGARDARNGYRFVTRASVEKLRDGQRMIAALAVMPGDRALDHDLDPLPAPMLRAADTIDPCETDESA